MSVWDEAKKRNSAKGSVWDTALALEEKPVSDETPDEAYTKGVDIQNISVDQQLPISTVEQNYDEISNWNPNVIDPDDLPQPEEPLPAEQPQLIAGEEPGFWNKFFTAGYTGRAKPEHYWDMNPVKRFAFDAYMASGHILNRVGATAAREAGLITRKEALSIYEDELVNNPDWYTKGPELVGYSAEKITEYYAMKGIFKVTGLHKLLTSSGQKLASRFVTKQIALVGGSQVLNTLSRAGLKKVANDGIAAFLKFAPENIAFLASWSASSAALKGEDKSEAAWAGALWGAGFSAISPAAGAVGKIAIATKFGQKAQTIASQAYTSLWQNFPRLMNYGRKPFSDELLNEAKRQFKARFGVDPTAADVAKLKKVTRMVGDEITKAAQKDASINAYWNSGAKAATEEAAKAAPIKPTEIAPVKKPVAGTPQPTSTPIVQTPATKPDSVPTEVKVLGAKVLANIEQKLKTNKKVFGVLANAKGAVAEALNEATKNTIPPQNIEIKTPDGWKPISEMPQKNKNWWSFSKQVTDEYHKIASTRQLNDSFGRPSKETIKEIATRLGISQADVTRSFTIYNSANPQEEIKSMVGDKPVPIIQLTPSQPQAQGKVEKGVGKPVQVGGKTYTPTTIPTDQINVDPKTFQFKLGAKLAGGVTEALQEVDKFDPVKAGQVLVWQNKAGKYFVVDGHHRVALAKKTGAESLNTWVIREVDGWTSADARATGALRNLADGKGTAIDAAKLFRDSDITIDKLKKQGVPTNNAIVKQGMDMKDLSDYVFRLVVDEKLPANFAAPIGRNVKNDAQQKQVADLILEGEIDTVRQAELLSATINSAPVLTTSEHTLFGLETTEKSLYAERAKVLANIEQKLKTNKKVFGVLAKSTGIIEAKGNILKKVENIAAKEQAEEVLFMLEKLANAKGAVAEALNEATKEYAKNSTKENLTKVTNRLLEQWTEGPGKLRVPDGSGVQQLPLERAAEKAVEPKIAEKPIKKEVKQVKTGEPVTLKAFHGTPDGRFLPEFDPNKKGYFKDAPELLPENDEFISLHGGIKQGFKGKSVTGNIGVSFTDNRSTAQSYADKPSFDIQNSVPLVVEREITLYNPKVIDLQGKQWTKTVNNDIKTAIQEGHDGLILKNIKDNYHPSTTNKPTNNLIVFNPELIKEIKQPDILKGKGGFIDVTPLAKIHEAFMSVIEPSKAVEIAQGKDVYAEVIKGVHRADVAMIDFNEKELESLDGTLGEYGKALSKYSNKILENLMLSRGKPVSESAKIIQAEALEQLAKDAPELVGTRKMITRISDFNYDYLTEVVGDKIGYVEDYFYGLYKDPRKVEKFLDYWKTTKRFTKQKKLPTVADAKAFGLDLRDSNPINNLRSEYMAIARLDGMISMKDALMKSGEGKYIAITEGASIDWDKVNDPVFADVRLAPELAKMINNLISTNKITRQPLLNTIRQVNNFLRTVKFIGSAFHLGVEAKQALADSGYLGFLHKKTALRGATTGFKKSDPIFQTPEYKDYVLHGGGHRYSIDSEAQRAFSNTIDKINDAMGITGAGKVVKGAAFASQLPEKFVEWMFESYIPKLKYGKFLDGVRENEIKLGRSLTSAEKIDIIKEQQNFYGMMNERLFGRSGTVTTLLRFKFMAPGFAEGNFRSILKSILQWGGDTGFKAGRSRANIINSFIISATAATIGTMIFTGKTPKKPETLKDIRDIFKIDTGHVDKNGRRIMIDILSYDKDYWDVFGNIATLQPGKAIGGTVRRLGGMTSTTWDVISDINQLSMGKALYDYKGDRIVEITDSFIKKTLKLSIHELKKGEPISTNVFQQVRQKGTGIALSAAMTLTGVRLAKSEEDKREIEVLSQIFSMRDQQERLYYYLGTLKNPREHIKNYNKTVMKILNNPITPLSIKDEYESKLIIDVDRITSNKVYRYLGDKAKLAEYSESPEKHHKDIKELQDSIKKDSGWLKNFEIGESQYKSHLVTYEKLHRKIIKEIQPEDNLDELKKDLAKFYADQTLIKRRIQSGDETDTDIRLVRKYNTISSNISEIARRIYDTENEDKRVNYFNRIQSVIKRINN